MRPEEQTTDRSETDTERTPRFVEECGHEVRMALRHAEAKCSACGTLPELLERILRTSLCCNSRRQRFLVKAGAPPRNVRIIHIIWNTK